jgi:hypothetical protein
MNTANRDTGNPENKKTAPDGDIDYPTNNKTLEVAI